MLWIKCLCCLVLLLILQKLGDAVIRPFLQVNFVIFMKSTAISVSSSPIRSRKYTTDFFLSQDVIQFGPLVKTLGLVMLTQPQILPSIFKQVIIFCQTCFYIAYVSHFVPDDICFGLELAIEGWSQSDP